MAAVNSKIAALPSISILSRLLRVDMGELYNVAVCTAERGICVGIHNNAAFFHLIGIGMGDL